MGRSDYPERASFEISFDSLQGIFITLLEERVQIFELMD
jgi:hypothetical protein